MAAPRLPRASIQETPPEQQPAEQPPEEQQPEDALPADQEEPLVEDRLSITVTANKREQDLQDVGISITALDGEALRELDVTTTSDLTQQVPNVYVQDFFGGAGVSVNATIRGIGLNDFNPGTEPSSVLYVDEFYVAPTLAGSMLLHDVERVEVLRGPQGTLFGRNTTGGAIHYVTKDPTSETEGFVRASLGSYGLRRFEGAANVAISDRVAARVSFISDNNDPWARNVGPGPGGHERRFNSIRGQVRVDITDNLSSLTKVTYGRATGLFSIRQGDLAEGFDSNGFMISTGPGPFLSPVALNDFTVGDTNRPDEVDSTSVLAVQRFDWQLGDVTLTSVTGHLDLDQSHIEDCDGTPLDSCHVEYPYEAQETTQEVRATGRLGGISGLRARSS